MRFAALADIHSNVFALEAVLQDAKQRGVELMVNLGDSLYGPMAPKATYDLLGEHEFVSVCGNQDRLIVEAATGEIDSNPTLRFVLNDLDEVALDWLRSLRTDWQLGDDVFLCHGAPANDLVYLLEDVKTGKAQVRTDSEIYELLNGCSAKIVLCGHTHIPRTVSLDSGQLVINPGSVGLPAYTDDEPILHSMENFCPHASYAIVEKSRTGWRAEHIKVPYEYQKAVNEAKKRDRADWAHFLATGRGL